MWAIDLALDEDGYRWRLWSADGRQVCVSAQAFQARANAERYAARFGDAARDLTYETVAYEPGRYGWRAVTAEGTPVACSAGTFPSDTVAKEAADRVKRFAAVASGV